MPELPEVETVARKIETHIIHKTISEAKVFWPRSIEEPNPTIFTNDVRGQTILKVGRRAKYICITLTHGQLFIHLRMSGDLLYFDSEQPIAKHDRVILVFTDGSRIAFNDPRKFGRIWLTDQAEHVTGKIGPEPLEDSFTLEIFTSIINSSDRNIKAFLLDQHKIAGLGNIYTDEALFLSGILPSRKTSSLQPKEVQKLYNSIREVLSEGIKNNGASFDWVYRGGNFQNHFNVYKRTGEACKLCGNPIIKTTIHQRGTHYCDHCQK